MCTKYRCTFNYAKVSIRNLYDDECELDFQSCELKDYKYIYENLDYDHLIDLLKRDVCELNIVENGEIIISLSCDD